ncbi:putative nuclease HARBI1 isoform X3 [Pistacia vera]|uniref:putative nuclease HARBI1 isoform X3 n=1 Tax=Pistacia vera TaxID=55513 RepID=UPI0012635D93|nr:putative nuclease HARBI1 isoform X3 [Pistacia vera]
MALSSHTNHNQDNDNEKVQLYIHAAAALCGVIAYEMEFNMHGRQSIHTSALNGHDYMVKLLNGHYTRIYNKCRMSKRCFQTLCYILAQRGKLRVIRHMSIEEQVMIFLTTVEKNVSNSDCREDYQHSGETISRYVYAVCDAILELTSDFIKPPNFTDVLLQISTNPKYYSFFKDCLGAIDGTHVHGLPVEVADTYRNRKGAVSQNVMAVCDFNMLFTYVVTGWEGSSHDARVLNSVLNDPNSGFPHPPPGKYYLVNAGYANRGGFLAPHRRVPYHVPDARRNLSGPMELFNYRHASLWNVVERTFGVLKKRFCIIDGMNNYSLEKQAKIVMACCVIHNFIKRFDMNDPIFQKFNADGVYEEGNGTGSNQLTQRNTEDMGRVRDSITTAMWAEHESMSYC